MGFWDDYRRSLKPADVEEPIDLWLHRPLGYVLARSLLSTPVSPNAVTLTSIGFGAGALYFLLERPPWGMQWAALCVVMSAVLDCADGQLARLRGTSSPMGRMLDGVADLTVALAVVGGGGWVIWTDYRDTPWLAWSWIGAAAVTVATGSLHTSLYDHYKNVYLRMTTPAFREGEDQDAMLERHRGRSGDAWYVRLTWPIYLFYVRSQARYAGVFDPHTSVRLSALPAYTEERARVYRECALPAMRVWRGWFGFGSLVFGLALCFALEVPEYYVLIRGTLLNAVLLGYLRPLQQRASRTAFERIGWLHAGRPA